MSSTNAIHFMLHKNIFIYFFFLTKNTLDDAEPTQCEVQIYSKSLSGEYTVNRNCPPLKDCKVVILHLFPTPLHTLLLYLLSSLSPLSLFRPSRLWRRCRLYGGWTSVLWLRTEPCCVPWPAFLKRLLCPKPKTSDPPLPPFMSPTSILNLLLCFPSPPALLLSGRSCTAIKACYLVTKAA